MLPESKGSALPRLLHRRLKIRGYYIFECAEKGPNPGFGFVSTGGNSTQECDMSPEKRGMQSVTAHGTVDMYSYSFRYFVRDENGFLAYGRFGEVLRFQTLGVDRGD